MKSTFLLAGLMALSLWGGTPALAQTGDCVIKGNVNTRGERIYHVPGQ